jgi:hypothetical protein
MISGLIPGFTDGEVLTVNYLFSEQWQKLGKEVGYEKITKLEFGHKKLSA